MRFIVPLVAGAALVLTACSASTGAGLTSTPVLPTTTTPNNSAPSTDAAPPSSEAPETDEPAAPQTEQSPAPETGESAAPMALFHGPIATACGGRFLLA